MRYRKYWIAGFSIFMLALSSECRAFPLFGTTETEKRPIQLLEQLIYEKVNEARMEYNPPELEWTSDVADVARKHSEDMGIKEHFAHENKEGELVSERLEKSGIVFTVSAENIFKCTNYPDIVEEAVKGWMESPGHRANILNGDVTETGVGIYKVKGKNEYYITQNFIKRALKFIPSPSKLSEEEIGKMFNIVKDTISKASNNYRNLSSSMLKEIILKELINFGIPIEKDFVVEGFLKDSLTLSLKIDLRVNNGLIINFTNGRLEDDKGVFSQLINPQGYSAVILICTIGERIEYLLIKTEEQKN